MKESRQRKWQRARKAAGVCITCGKPLEGGSSNYCALHHLKRALKGNALRIVAHYQATNGIWP